MIVETGHYALALALAVALLQSVLPLWGTRRGDSGLASVAVPAAIAQFLLLGFAFAALTYAHVVSDFSLVTVAENSLTTKPLVYKIAGVWGNHEGSMLLWVLILAAFGAAVAILGRGMADELRANTLAVQGWISLAFLCFILFTSDPFARSFPAPFEGRDLNPLLQDPGLAIHCRSSGRVSNGYAGCGGGCRRRIVEPSEASDTKIDAGQRGCGTIGA